MDVREKLVEFLRAAIHNDLNAFSKTEEIADHLIANGVTVQEWDGCEHCKEDNDGCRTMFGAFSITNPFHGNEWFINTGHCKPWKICFCPMCGRRLPQPPKGE